MTDLVAFAVFGAALLAALGVGEALRAGAGWAPEASRRTVHALVGVATAASVPLFSAPTAIYALALGFGAVNIVASPRRIFPGMHGIGRPSWGTVTFPLALLAALFLAWTLDPGRTVAIQAAFLALGLADPAASFVGTRVRRPHTYTTGDETKSLEGSAAFAIVATGSVAAVLAASGEPLGWSVGAGLLAGALATAAEALGRRGWDNLWIVLAVLTVVVGLREGAVSPRSAALGAALALGFGVVAWRARSLDTSGALAAGLLAWLVVAAGGWAWAVPIFVFFVLSSALSRLGRRRKAAAETLAEKGSRRDAGQVVANGGVAGALLLSTVFVPAPPAVYWAFLGALAAAAADTWATEIGTLVGGPTRRLGIGARVPPGTSGGMSVAGTLGGLAGAVAVVLSALPFAEVGPVTAAWIVAGGFAGGLFDTLLGGTVQARYRSASGALTERREEGGVALPLAAGLPGVGNDAVNLACTALGAAAAASLVWALA